MPTNFGPEEGEPADAIETHPLNPAATRKPGGYWNEDSLPITDWEVPDQRVVLSEHLRHVLGDDTPPVLRWARRKYQAVVSTHRRDLGVISRLSTYLNEWQYAGIEPGRQVRRVLFQDESQRWYSASFGRDETGSYNVVTVFGGSDKKFLANRLRGVENIVRNEKCSPVRAADRTSLSTARGPRTGWSSPATKITFTYQFSIPSQGNYTVSITCKHVIVNIKHKVELANPSQNLPNQEPIASCQHATSSSTPGQVLIG